MSAQKPQPGNTANGLLGFLGLSVIAGCLVTALVAPAIAVTGMVAQGSIGVFESLPDHITLDSQAQKNIIYATDNAGNPVHIAEMFHQNREEIKMEEVSDNLKYALVAAEDRKFYQHGGVNVSSVIRAAISNASGGGKQGASTITMQLVKNILIMESLELPTKEERDAARAAADEQTIERKLREMKLAISLEKRYSKDEILLAYLNIAGFGGNTYGIQAAAEQFFSVDAKDLSLPQAASLIAIVQTPTYHSLNNPDNYEANKKRRDTVVLTGMLELGYIDQAAYDEAVATPIEVVPTAPKNGCVYAAIGSYFCDYITWLVPELESLGSTPEERQKNWQRGGYSVYTTLDVEQQSLAESQLAIETPGTESRFQLGAAASAVEAGTGRIVAMAQNTRFDNSEFGGGPGTAAVNYNTDRPYGGSSGFQVGSTYKIFTLAEWLKQNHGLNEAVDGRVKTYNQADFKARCASYGGTWKAPNYANAAGSASTSVLQATARSINSAYAAMAMKLDLCDIRDTALSMGAHRADGGELQPNPSAILGTNEIAPLSMASAVATVSSGGTYCKPIAIDRIVDARGTELPGQNADCQRAITPEVAAGVAAGMRAVMTGGGTGVAANPGGAVPVIGKTGTSDNAVQTWMVGGSTKATLAVWVGNVEGKASIPRYNLPKGNAGTARFRMFRTMMGSLNTEYGGEAFPEPPGKLVAGQLSTVPDVAGQTKDQARSLLSNLGFTVEDGPTVESNRAEGTVAATVPAAGSRVSKGTSISLSFSDGSLTKTVPSVGGLKRNAAVSAISDAGISGSVSVTYVATTDASLVCQVAESAPVSGTPVRADAGVALTVYSANTSAPPAAACQ